MNALDMSVTSASSLGNIFPEADPLKPLNAENCGSSSYFMLANGAEQFWLNLLTELEKLPWKIQHRVKADKFSHR